MSKRTLSEEILSTSESSLPGEHLFLTLLKTADALAASVAPIFEVRGITPSQYNVLRILRGAGDKGLCCVDIGRRLIHRLPDVSRLLDRLEALGLVERLRSEEDRRMMLSRLTPAGLELVNSLDEPVASFHQNMLGSLDRERTTILLSMLEDILGLVHEQRTCAGKPQDSG